MRNCKRSLGSKGDFCLDRRCPRLRKANITEARRFTFDAGQKTWNKSSIADELAWHRQGVTTFHLLAAEYKGVIFLRSLNQETRDNPTTLNMFVP